MYPPSVKSVSEARIPENWVRSSRTALLTVSKSGPLSWTRTSQSPVTTEMPLSVSLTGLSSASRA